MTWYGIVILFMLVGSGCVAIGVLTGLEAKHYKVKIEREKQALDALKAFTALLLVAKLTVSVKKALSAELPAKEVSGNG